LADSIVYLENHEMETAKLNSHPTMSFFGGALAMLLAITLGAWIISYLIGMSQVGPYPPWEAIDKNIGIGAAIYGFIAGNVLGLAGLAWYSLQRRDRTPFLGGLTVLALWLVPVLCLFFIQSLKG
jgi:hypothetical protein